MRWLDAMLFQISMRWGALCCCLTRCVESFLVLILQEETRAEASAGEEKGEEWAKEVACDIF